MANIYYQKDCNLAKLDGKTVAIIGYGSQGHAHALNLHDSGVDVIVGLYEGSKSWAKAEAAGLKVMTSAEAAKNADIIMILINDEKQAKLYKESIEPNLEEGNMLMFLGAACMAGGFGFAFSVCQSHAIIISGEDQKGLANSTFYIGVDIGMSTGPFLGAMLWEYLPIEWFFWVLFLFAPATPLLWLLTKQFRRGPRHA